MEQPHSRPRSKSTFSFKSDKSNKHKDSLHESAEEKRKNHLTNTTKANPNAAMEEAQPIAAALEKPTLQSLRSFQHVDTNGQPIAEPDLSNPTRPRWERPLDTIKSFEAAIDNEYRRRAQAMRGDSATEIMSGYGSRRSSYYGGGYEQNRFSQVSGHYGNRQSNMGRDSWAENGHGGYPPPRGPRYGSQRMQSDPGWNRYNNGPGGHGVYPSHGYQQSRDTVNTGGSGSQSDPYSADPSSENSSIERGGPVRQPDGEQYGFSGFGGAPQYPGAIAEESRGPDGYFPQHPNGAGMAPPVPAKAQPPPNNPNVIKLSGSGQADAARPNVLSRKDTANTEKRKSWFKRRFSKD